MGSAIVFVSLFLGLTTGVHTIELEVDGPVASIEVMVDGKRIAMLDAEPWQVDYDFGARLLPHELLAIARNRSGRVLGRARQLVNAPRPEVETKILLQRDQQGLPRSAKVIWESVAFDQVEAIRAVFDGQQISNPKPERIVLPDYDPAATHLFAVELELPENQTSRAELSFGGFYGAEISMELTATSIVPADDDTEPTLASMTGCFKVKDQLLQVVAVEKGHIALYMVQDELTRHLLRNLQRRHDLRAASSKGRSLRRYTAGRNKKMNKATAPPKRGDEIFDRVCFIHPEALRKDQQDTSTLLFAVGDSLRLAPDSLPWLLSQRPGALIVKRSQSLSDAVAVAGVRAAAGRTRCAVVLVLSEQPVDDSRYQPQAVRAYLQSINVPFVIWIISERDTVMTPWGLARGISGIEDLQAAAAEIEEQLARQWIVWLDGAHLASSIRLTEKGQGIRLAGLPDLAPVPLE